MNRIRLETRDSVGHIILARPDRRNALDRKAADDLHGAIRKLEADQAVSAIVLSAEGKDFCAGADLHALRAMLDYPLHTHEADAQALGNVFLALHECSKPTIAVVQGKALAGGAGLAMSCDLIVAHENASFGYPEVAIGFVPAMAMALLVRAVGERTAFELVATGRRVGASEARRIGLVSHSFSEAEFDSGVATLVAQVAAAPREAMSATKRLLHVLRTLTVREGIAVAVQANAQARLTDDFRNGVLRFTEGNPVP